MKPLIVYIHGIGRTEKSGGYAQELVDSIGHDKYDHTEYSWQSYVEERTDSFFNKNFQKPTGWHWKKKITWLIRRALFDYAEDALIYPQVKDQLINNLHEGIKDREEVILVGHSLGGLLAYDYMKAYPSDKVKKLITIGCNIPLFTLGEDNFMLPKLEDGSWINIYELNDVLSMRIDSMNMYLDIPGQRHLANLVKDIEVKTKGIKGASVASHNSYWRSERVHEIIKGEL